MPAIITVENLSKAYRIGHKEKIPDTLVGAAKSWISDPLRNLRNLRKLDTFSEDQDGEDIVWALRDVSFEIKQGEVVGIIGRNGAGKSTLLKILSNITEPTRGRAIIRGRISSLLEVGTGFHQEMTGRDNIYMNGTVLGMTKREIDRKFDEIVDFSGVERFLDTPIKRYSSGMQVRLAFAVAAHLEPEILIVDEVLAVGDTEFQKKCLGKMEDASRSGRTVLFVSHNMAAVDTLCTRTVMLQGGQLTLDGPTDEAIAYYYDQLDEAHHTLGQYQYLADNRNSQRKNPVMIRSARITSEHEFRQSGYRIGEPLEFEVTCLCNENLMRPALGIGIDNSIGQRIVTLHSETALPHKTSPNRHLKFICRLSELVLVPGRYSVKLSLENANQELEVLENAFSFEILTTDFYRNTGRIYRGVVLCKQSWVIQSVN